MPVNVRIVRKIKTYTIMLPRSGCLKIIRAGTIKYSKLAIKNAKELSLYLLFANLSAKKIIKKNLKNSEAWKLKKYRSIQRFDPFASRPIMKVIHSNITKSQ